MKTLATIVRSQKKSTNDRFLIATLSVLGWLALSTLSPAVAGAVTADDASPVPVVLTAEEVAWAHATFTPRGTDLSRLRRLHEALSNGDGSLGPDAFAMRFVAFARELGLRAYFVLVDRPAVATDRGLRSAGGPVLAAAYGVDGRVVVFDATAVSRPPHRTLEVLSDRKATAVIHRNAGLALLRDGNVGGALERLENAVELAPNMASAWFTLGGALRRAGQPAQALDAYERSIALALARP